MATNTSLLLEPLQSEVDIFLQQARDALEEAAESFYKEIVFDTAAEVKILVKGETDSSLRRSVSVEDVTSVIASVDLDGVRFSEKWKSVGSTGEKLDLKSIATPIPLLTESLTPRRTSKATSIRSKEDDWGDRIRSHSPQKEETIPQKTEVFWNPIGEKPSMIPRPPPTDPPPETQAMEEVVEEAMEAEEKLEEMVVEPFSVCEKPPVVMMAAEKSAKPRIPALKKAAIAKEKQEKRELERKKRKEQILKWKQDQQRVRQPEKLSFKPEASPHNGVKRRSELESSINKKRRLEPTNKETEKKKPMNEMMKNQTPELGGTPLMRSPGEVGCSPQYELTPIGMVNTDYDKKAYRRDKRIPSWANANALVKSMMPQREDLAESLTKSLSRSADLREIFGTPNPMVIRYATKRAYKYDHRAASSVHWSDEDSDNDSVN